MKQNLTGDQPDFSDQEVEILESLIDETASRAETEEAIADSAYELAEKIIEFDERNPGDPESDIVVPFAVWADWIDLAGKAGQKGPSR